MTTNNRLMVSLRDLTVRKTKQVVCEVRFFAVAERERVCIVGPNGAGKTTLLRVLGGLENSFDGTRTIAAERAVFVHQTPIMFRGSVSANVEYAVRTARRGDSRRDVRYWLDRFSLTHLAGRQARSLSGGEQRRVAVARACAANPDVLLLDEPFAELDETSACIVQEVLDSEVDMTIVVTSPFAIAASSFRRFDLPDVQA